MFSDCKSVLIVSQYYSIYVWLYVVSIMEYMAMHS